MPDSHPVSIPLLNPNEPEALLASLNISEGQKVSAGDLLGSLETTKSTSELIAEFEGYIVGLNFQEDDTVRAGDILCYIALKADWEPPKPKLRKSSQSKSLPEGLRITQPALVAAKVQKIDLASLPIGPLITESMLLNLSSGTQETSTNLTQPQETISEKALLVYGGGGHGKAVIDLINENNKYEIHGLIDDNMNADQSIMGLKILGGSEVLADLHKNNIGLAANAVGGIGDIMSRVRVFQRLAAAGFYCPSLIHPTAFVENSVSLAPGVHVFPQSYIGSQSAIGFGCIINTGVIISHDCELEAYVNIAPGAILAGSVHIGETALVGMGVTVNLGVSIGARARIGNGAIIKADVPIGGIVRAGSIWPK